MFLDKDDPDNIYLLYGNNDGMFKIIISIDDIIRKFKKSCKRGN